MRKLSACLVAACLAGVPTSASAGPDRNDPWQRAETFEWSTSRGRLGVMVMSMTADLRHYFGAPSERGVLVAKVEPNSPAAHAGIRVGDVITVVRGETVDDAGDVLAALAPAKQGDKVKVELVRDRKPLAIETTMTASSSLSSLQWLRGAFPWFDASRWSNRATSASST